ncbi:hypothetical protein SNE40_017755 [Patella caerulea]|uniref:Beta-glucuronidase n=1 Tax=Patella caerulea TaxID=87958 RepID=A0AAN8JIW7_PATCE
MAFCKNTCWYAMLLLLLIAMTSCIMVDVTSAPAVQNISSMFVGVTIDLHVMRDGWRTMDFSSQKMLTLAKGLAPCYLRVGGTGADFLIFNRTQERQSKRKTNRDIDPVSLDFSMSVLDWDTLNQFVQQAGWELIFGLNALLRANGRWDPTNAIKLLKYTIEKGYKPAAYELGNEPDLYPRINNSVSPASLVDDFGTLRHTLTSMSPSPPLLFGPDTAYVNGYFQQFLQASKNTTVDAVTWHHYYFAGSSGTVEKYHNISILDSLKPLLIDAVGNCTQYAPNKPCWLGETSSSYSGGTTGVSDKYVAGFLWLDKLGLSALYGLKCVIRQSFYGRNNSLIDVNLNPNPDYWLTILYQRLVGSPVLNVSQNTDPNVRVYAHCTNTDSGMGYQKGSVTVYLMNLGHDVVSVDINGGTSQNLYMLSPGDGNGLVSPFVKLNGEILMLPNDMELPPLKPFYHEGTIALEALQFGFVVLPDARKWECL